MPSFDSHPQSPPAPSRRGAAVLLFFELRAPSGVVVRCPLYRTDNGLELRLESGGLPPERVASVPSYGRAQELAARWREELVLQRRCRSL